MTRAHRVEFVGAIAEPGQPIPQQLPQVAIAGKSNVGKSTLLNRLVARKKLARTSKQPGRTREINFFRVDDRFLLADLPGYGYAKVPKEVRDRWAPLIEDYLLTSPRLLGLVLLIDIRRGLTADDRRMLAYLGEIGLPTLFALTKVDKLNRSGRRAKLADIRKELDADEEQLLETSGTTGEGVEDLWDSVLKLVEEG